MELFSTSANHPQDVQKTNTVKPNSELIIDQVPTLPLHFKLVLYACVSLISQNRKDEKVALTDVFLEYRKLAADLNIDWLSMSRINELARELEMLGFLKCSYTRKRNGRVKYVRFFEPAQIPKCTSILKDGLGKSRLEKDFGIR